MQRNQFIRYLRFLLIFFIAFVSSSFNAFHPFYVSVSEIKINSKTKSVEVSCKMFTDDLQEAIYRLYKTPIDLSNKEEDNNLLLSKYLKEKFAVKIGGRTIELQLIGYENIEEATWCYLEGSFQENSKNIMVENSLLYDFLKEQTNMIHCYFDKERKSYKLDNPKNKVLFDF
jgi:hypothetical protein